MKISGQELMDAASAVIYRAYAPYSRFSVGCALLVEDGTIVTGVNVENGSYGLTICAERCAVCAGVASGHKRFVAAAVASTVQGATPCGACRQVLSEFMSESALVFYIDLNGELKSLSIAELLPHPFSSVGQG